jgi:alpha-glucoside transport system substrate-binding protein
MRARSRSWPRRTVAGGAALAACLVLSGCLQNPNSAGSGGGLDGYVDTGADDGDGEVTILGAFGGAEAEGFEAALKEFEDESGIDVKYENSADFTTLIKQRVSTGDVPDIALFPQPGGLLELAADGKIQPIDTYLDFDQLERTLVPGLLESARLNGRYFGAPMRVANKSIIWYPKKVWDQNGYEVPKTLDDLYALADQIRGDGIAPWCMAWGADAATGWVGTDWIEQLILTLNGPEYYNDWIQHAIPFDDDGVVEAFDEFSKIAREKGEVFGGTDSISSTPVAESMVPAFRNPPQCVLERQGNFEVSFLPTDIQANLDEEVGVFSFPPQQDTGETPPLLGGGDLAGLFNGNDDDAIEVMEFITSDEFGGPWAQAGGWLSPHRTFDDSNYPNEISKQIAEQTTSASLLVFDGSDVMPKEVGSGTFWTGMTEWLSGKSSSDTAADIEGSWPE